ncbi:hypothetical protein [Kineosporia sp. A_224]|uniref:hypothetical protein n=1 Tax=Kineosporia sp. A_224 TaxID=1962180 RepID=UPI000B4C0863|nr:hypothetical protein [Kineosporia sp. A_224]
MPLPRRPRTPGRPTGRTVARTTAVALTTAALTGCGGTAAPAATGTTSATAARPSPHKHTPGMRMNGAAPGPDASGSTTSGATPSGATPSAVADARTVPGRRLTRGTLAPAPGRPAGTQAVAGTAWLAAGTTGTTVTVELTGLPPTTWFMVHLQVGPCSDPDAAAFEFPAAAAGPAHELHVMFATRDDGTATVSGEDPGDAGSAVRSVAVLPESMTGRVACADLG